MGTFIIGFFSPLSPSGRKNTQTFDLGTFSLQLAGGGSLRSLEQVGQAFRVAGPIEGKHQYDGQIGEPQQLEKRQTLKTMQRAQDFWL